MNVYIVSYSITSQSVTSHVLALVKAASPQAAQLVIYGVEADHFIQPEEVQFKNITLAERMIEMLEELSEGSVAKSS